MRRITTPFARTTFVKAPLVACAVFSLPAFAEPYQWEVEGQYQKEDRTSSLSSSADKYNLWGKYYWSPVATDQGPLAEAAFLSRASNISLALGRDSYSIDSRYDYTCAEGPDCRARHYGSSADNTQATLGFEYYLPESWLYFAGRYQYSDRSSDVRLGVNGQDTSYQYTSDHDYWSASVGITPLEGWLLAAEFGEGGYGSLFEGEANVSSKYLWQFGGNRALNLEATYFIDNGYNDWQVGADYYFNNTLSLGASYGDDETAEIRLQKFVTDSIALEASYTDFGSRYGVDQGDGFSLGLTARF